VTQDDCRVAESEAARPPERGCAFRLCECGVQHQTHRHATRAGGVRRRLGRHRPRFASVQRDGRTPIASRRQHDSHLPGYAAGIILRYSATSYRPGVGDSRVIPLAGRLSSITVGQHSPTLAARPAVIQLDPRAPTAPSPHTSPWVSFGVPVRGRFASALVVSNGRRSQSHSRLHPVRDEQELPSCARSAAATLSLAFRPVFPSCSLNGCSRNSRSHRPDE
jgi:hypothetical protein